MSYIEKIMPDVEKTTSDLFFRTYNTLRKKAINSMHGFDTSFRKPTACAFLLPYPYNKGISKENHIY